MNTTLRMAGQTDVGRHRQDNQDTYLCTSLWDGQRALLLVIDGVGGNAGGAEAAALAKEAIGQYMAVPTGDALTMLREAVVFANNQILRQREENPSLARMSCVLTVAVADSDAGRLHYVHVGDTRLYRFRAGELQKLTRDHSLVGVREDAGQLTEAEAMHHPRRNEILRDVGSEHHRVDDPEFLESGETDLQPGDRLLLCSDGLTDMLNRAQITTILTSDTDEAAQVDELIRQANAQGGHDNITVVLAHVPSATVPSSAEGNGTASKAAERRNTSEAPVPASTDPVAKFQPPVGPGLPMSAGQARPAEKNEPAIWPWLLGALLIAFGIIWWFNNTPEPAATPPAATAPADTTPPAFDTLRVSGPAQTTQAGSASATPGAVARPRPPIDSAQTR